MRTLKRTLGVSILAGVMVIGWAPSPKAISEPQAWFYYTLTSPVSPIARKGAFDMRDLVWWEGVRTLKNEPMTYRIHLRCVPGTPVILDETNFQAFARAWDAFSKSLN